MTDYPDLRAVVDLELALQDRAVRGSRRLAGELLDPQFHEFGASGRVWDRESILDMMAADDSPPPRCDDMVATRLADDVVLLTYRTGAPGRPALRSSLWRRRDGGPWRVFFHQGTPVT
ncbi:DUF4440 domain-containing protein [Pseudonocardia sulfidoxydans NBRC 16205]|uniref:DUF4440 domain-containing protein n=1 Tax=Pseudonocardia sulfidoxydans NBRC 16205 TaxID=1223511 RepID=A0A511DKR9_9PSEU|nr:nuclear transport factor 2 family protein [Pseudonocardia sulfidoxydans]GEL23648.1 DUF4440 domain-containing protein [Pseudonocardia sulfidoxydans NBRC 16205]